MHRLLAAARFCRYINCPHQTDCLYDCQIHRVRDDRLRTRQHPGQTLLGHRGQREDQLQHAAQGVREPPIQQQLFCPKDERTILAPEEVGERLRVLEGQYVLFNEEELKAMEEKATQAIEISEFLPHEDNRSDLLREGLLPRSRQGRRARVPAADQGARRDRRWALAKYAARGKDIWSSSVRWQGRDGAALLPKSSARDELPRRTTVKDNELKMARQLTRSARDEFHPENYRDEVRDGCSRDPAEDRRRRDHREPSKSPGAGHRSDGSAEGEPCRSAGDRREAVRSSGRDQGRQGDGSQAAAESERRAIGCPPSPSTPIPDAHPHRYQRLVLQRVEGLLLPLRPPRRRHAAATRPRPSPSRSRSIIPSTAFPRRRCCSTGPPRSRPSSASSSRPPAGSPTSTALPTRMARSATSSAPPTCWARSSAPPCLNAHPRSGRTSDRLRDFLALVPRTWRAALEFRHASWFDEEVYEALRSHDIALVAVDEDEADSRSCRRHRGAISASAGRNTATQTCEAWVERIRSQPWQEASLPFSSTTRTARPARKQR